MICGSVTVVRGVQWWTLAFTAPDGDTSITPTLRAWIAAACEPWPSEDAWTLIQKLRTALATRDVNAPINLTLVVTPESKE